MASNIKARPQKEELAEKEVPETEAPETAPDSPLLDLLDAAVKKLIRSAKKRGYVTHDQINSVLPSEEVNSEQIGFLARLFFFFVARLRSLSARLLGLDEVDAHLAEHR